MKNKFLRFGYNSTFTVLSSLQKAADDALRNRFLQPALSITLLQLQKDIKAVRSFYKHYEKYQNITGPLKKKISLVKKLQIGGGERYLKDFINLDLFPPADIIWDCRYNLPFPDETFSFVFSEHLLEHLDFPVSAKNVLSEIYRVLKYKGELFIGVPDAGKAIRAYCSSNKRFLNGLKKSSYNHRQPPVELYGKMDLINYIFRDQANNPNYTIHYWAYDEENLKNLLISVGFRKIKKANFNPDYCNPKRKLYTLYIKAKKL
ncbi:class I SAM-dependent methyltransferase [bacterium]|nr:class I SAM-dependent methyltransferase [bacterium]